MIKQILATSIAVVGVTIGTIAYGQQTGPLTGMELHVMCGSSDSQMLPDCSAYLGGFVEGFVLGQEALELGHRPVCLPTGVTAPQMRLIVQKTMLDHPEILDMGARAVALKALVDAYQCKAGQRPEYSRSPN
jgi:hypothetical protein